MLNRIMPPLFLVLLFILLHYFPFAQTKQKYNVLFIAVDDLNDWVGVYHSNPNVKTPNIDALAKKGMTFTRAYCSAPICNPSRASLLTGVRPSTSGIYNNAQPFRNALPDAITLPQYFTTNGYEVYGAGKIFHERFYDSASWPVQQDRALLGSPFVLLQKYKLPPNGVGVFDWQPLPAPDEEMTDYKIVQAGIDFLKQTHEKPFFLAVGITKPHLPWYVPKKYFDMYPLSKIILPKTIPDDTIDLPEAGKRMAFAHGEISVQGDLHQYVIENKKWEQAVQGYLACISFADVQTGRLIEALEKSSYAKNTIIIFFGDHGFNLGEKRHWTKTALWERTTRVPFIIIAPGITKANSACERTVNLMDIYPTLIDLCSLPKKEGLEAMDITPLLKNPKLQWDHPSVTTMGMGNHSVRTERWRYIKYNDGGEELYDHAIDPNEWHNLAGDKKYAVTIKKLSEWLPKTNAAPAPLVDSTGAIRPRQ
jgi:arylsulfatase A-like enzyme